LPAFADHCVRIGAQQLTLATVVDDLPSNATPLPPVE